MDASGSSCYQITLQETVLLGEENPNLCPCCGQVAVALMNLPRLTLT